MIIEIRTRPAMGTTITIARKVPESSSDTVSKYLNQTNERNEWSESIRWK